MGRALGDFLNAYLIYTRNSEPPQSYHVWTCLAVIAGALERKVYMRWGRSIIHPNIYIILVGPAGRTKKGTAIDFGRLLLEGAGVTTVEGSVTREALIRRLSGSITNFSDNSTGEIKFQCALTCLSGELSVFLGQHNLKFLADLCDWYDCPRMWKYDTKNQGTDILDGVCFNILGATAPEWIPTILPEAAIGGGFTRRVIWIVEEDKRGTVVHPTVDEDLEQRLIDELTHIRLVSGEFTFSKNCMEYYAAWYEKEDNLISDGKPPIIDPNFAGYCETRATLIKKLGMILSVSEDSERVIRVRHFERGLELLENAERRMGRTFSGLGQARFVQAVEQVFNLILKHKQVTRSAVLRFLYRNVDLEAYYVSIRTLEAMGLIKHEVYENDELITLLKGADHGILGRPIGREEHRVSGSKVHPSKQGEELVLLGDSSSDGEVAS